MNVLVVGSGSIAQRHLANLIANPAISEVAGFSTRNDAFNHIEHGKFKKVGALSALGSYSFAIIANETANHLEVALLLAGKGIPLFIEKPLSHSMENLDRLTLLVEEKNLPVMVGYNLRFLEAIQFLKQKLNAGAIGRPYFARLEVGQWLPDWRPTRDYRQSYSASKKRGGGVALDLSHELDSMRFLFGDPSSSQIVESKVSELDVDSCDVFEGVFRFPSGFLCTVHMDYLQRRKTRRIRIAGSDGELECDLIRETIQLHTFAGGAATQTELWDDPGMFELKQSFEKEILHFMHCLQTCETPLVSLDDGIAVLKLLEAPRV